MAAWIRLLFVLAAAYDGLLGFAFLAMPAEIFERFEVEPPNHYGYVQFPALLLILFAILFLQIAAHPRRNRGLILYGVGLKLSYCGVALGYYFTRGIPSMWLPFAWADLGFLILFLVAYQQLKAKP